MRYLTAFADGFPPPEADPPGRLYCYVWHCMQGCACQQAVLVRDGARLWCGSLWVNADEQPWLDVPGALSPEEELHVSVLLVLGALAWLLLGVRTFSAADPDTLIRSAGAGYIQDEETPQ